VSDVQDQLWPVFEAETREQLQAMAAGVMELEGRSSPEVADSLRRIAHTLKGSAASLGFHDLERAAHAVEDVIAVADGSEPLAGGAIEAVLRATRAMEESLSASARGRVADLERVLEALHAAVDRRAAGAPEPREVSDELEELSAEIGALCTSDGPARSERAARACAAAERLVATLPGAAADIARRVARALAGMDGDSANFPRAVARVVGDIVELRGAVAALSGPLPPAADQAKGPAGQASRRGEQRNVRVDATRLDGVAADVDQIVVNVSRRERRGRDLQRMEQSLREVLRLVERGLAETGLAEDARPRAIAGGLERLQALAGDFGRHGREVRRESESERLVAHALRGALQDLRMVPAETALAALRPAVRDLAAQLGKKASLRLEGGEVRLDRKVLDELKAPLLHLVRNALDHGIESADARRAAGKPPEATLEIRVEARGGQVVMTVRDDGAGLSPERLRAAAVERGLMSAEEARSLGDAEAAQLAFEPGVSTASTITAVSGRGVGLDVVAEAVQRLGGGVRVEFERGLGTAFVLTVPLTISGARGLLVRAEGSMALVPLDAVERVLLVAPEDVGTVAGQPTVSVDGTWIPFSTLVHAVGFGGGASLAGLTVALLVSFGGKRVVLAVDEVLGEHEIVVTSLGRRLAHVRHIAGAAVLDDGRVVAVLQPAPLVGAPRMLGAVKEPAPARIIVADDSLSTRAAGKAILEIAGYHVLPAADGEEALALAREMGCDLIVSDVQMPGLDGLGLTRRIKADPKLSHVPVILVTSLEGSEDRVAGLKAGADGYLLKRDVQQGKLLQLVRQLLPA
jgi:two-component system chemotaxis sensor kinase CheA